MSFIKIFCLLSCLLTSAAYAEDSPQSANPDTHSVWLNPGFLSHHFQREKGFRENNYGLGAQVYLSASQSVMAGYYRNSDNYWSHYASWVWQPLNPGEVKIGLLGAVIDGYPKMRHGQWFLAAMPVISFEYQSVGINFTVIPSYQDKIGGAMVIQLKFRVW